MYNESPVAIEIECARKESKSKQVNVATEIDVSENVTFQEKEDGDRNDFQITEMPNTETMYMTKNN